MHTKFIEAVKKLLPTLAKLSSKEKNYLLDYETETAKSESSKKHIKIDVAFVAVLLAAIAVIDFIIRYLLR
jgi:hypothetical protein